MEIRELNIDEIEAVSGAVDYGAVGAGLGSVAIGLAIASGPVGWVGIAGATAFSLAGGYSIGYGLYY